MSHILFVTWDGGGNVTPALAIARRLKTDGESVRFLGQSQQREHLERDGFGFAAYRTPGPWTATGKRNARTNAVGFLRLLAGRSLGRDLIAEVRAHPADLVVIDCLLYGALDAAVRARLPHVVLVHSLFAAVEQKMASGVPGMVARALGLNPWSLWSNADAVIVTSIQELDIPSGNRRSPGLEYTGPVLPELAESIRSISGQPRSILVSLSTTYIAGQVTVLQHILDAVSGLPIDVVVTTGPAIDPEELDVPSNVQLHRYVPHNRIMPTVDLVVGHGGHATTTQALAYGLPLVILPINPAFDQPLIGRRIRDTGAGVTLPSSASPAEIRTAIERVLADASYRTKAAQLGATIRASDGARTAADRLESLIANVGQRS